MINMLLNFSSCSSKLCDEKIIQPEAFNIIGIHREEKAIIVKNLYKTYYVQKFVPPPVKIYRKIRGIKPKLQGVQALKNINFEVNKGEIFGIIGPDGAGKTTLFRILTTLLFPDNEQATILIENYDALIDFQKIRNISGYMPGKFSLYMDLTVEENLRFFATLFNTTIEENYHLIKDIYQQIEPFKGRKAGALSGGMKQKLALSCALIHKPKVLFLDEPTTGVDPVSRREFWEMLHRLKEEKITILVSTPYMDEARLCDRIAFIQNGKILTINTPEKIIADFPYKIYAVEAENNYEILKQLRQNPVVQSVFSFGDSLHVIFNEDFNPQNEDHNAQCSIFNAQFKEITPNIEDCYMKLSQNESD